MSSERIPILASFVVSLALNSSIFLSVNQSMGSQAKWQRPKALSLMEAHQKAHKIELEFVEAPPQKPLRKPEKSKKIAAQDSLAQDQSRLKTQAVTVPDIAKVGVADQLSQRRTEDRMVPPLRAQEAKKEPPPMTPKEEAPEEKAQEEALEQAAMQLTSRDKITTMEMAVKRSSGASFHGVTSFEATGSGMGAYMKNLKDRIWLEWFPYIAFRYPVTFETADAVVRFMIGRQGEVKSVEVVSYRGSPMFATFCMQVVRRADGFGPLPKDLLVMMGKDELEIKFAFHYR